MESGAGEKGVGMRRAKGARGGGKQGGRGMRVAWMGWVKGVGEGALAHDFYRLSATISDVPRRQPTSADIYHVGCAMATIGVLGGGGRP